MVSLTAIHYTAHTEPEPFERKVREANRVAAGNVPIISVTHKPIDYGKNICVGEVGRSSANANRQFLIGAQAAETRFVCPVEGDFLYPPEYFCVSPRRDNVVYIVTPVWVAVNIAGKRKTFVKKPLGSEAAVVVGRNYFIDIMKKNLEHADGWGTWPVTHLYHLGKTRTVPISVPILTFKTDNQRRRFPYRRNSHTHELAPFGTWHEVMERYELLK